jgi:ABC-2 type transport system permease protein/oleandomycin transport system permease protein
LWIVGLLVGFQPAGTLPNWALAMALLLLASFTFSWFSALLGLLLSSVEAVQQSILLWAFPLVFASSMLVPTNTMPDWLRVWAEHQPVSLLINAIRGLVLNQPDGALVGQVIVWYMGLLVIIAPLAVWAYGRRSSR